MSKYNRHLRASLLTLLNLFLVLGAGFPAAAASYQVLHSFGVLTNLSGYSPESPLIQGPDGTLYGTGTSSEGSFRGTVFKIQPDGSGFTVLKRFGDYNGGQNPRGPLALVGNTLYGTAESGGLLGGGSVYAIHTDGTGFTNLYNFPYNLPTDGQNPFGGVIAAGNVLYGATYRGANGAGTIFRMNTDGTAYTNLHLFTALTANTNNDGGAPYGSLTVSGSVLYGATYSGGTNGSGTVFALNTDGTGYAVLHHFGALNSNTNTDGANPEAGLALSGGRLYGTTFYGGRKGRGVVFAVNVNGTASPTCWTWTIPSGLTATPRRWYPATGCM